tara:strand:- start:741 stop:1049 length:309 start_codon:yes stop_codon:yes gene_type:complete
MKIHWLIKYYLACFIAIFFVVLYIEKGEPFVNWSLYTYVEEKEIKKNILNKDCERLKALYLKEYNLNYKKNFLGFNNRIDKKSIRGLNLLQFLDYHISKNNC